MNPRTRFVVAGMAFLFLVAWGMSLGPLMGIHFWDQKYALERIREHPVAEDLYNTTALGEVATTYYSPRRYLFFFPHVLGAIVWWNLYFFQLIPKVRHAYNKKIHRVLGRVLFLAAFCQLISGLGLAVTSHSNTIKMVSFILALSAGYCVYHAYYYAVQRDIPRHKYWAMRMVGYLQTNVLQRFWILVLIISHQSGWYGMYPNLDDAPLEERNAVIYKLFDDSFLLAIFTAILVTEWYLAGEQGMMEPAGAPIMKQFRGKAVENSSEESRAHESEPLLH